MFAAVERAVVHEYSACSRNEPVHFVFKPPIVACPSRSRAFYCILVHISFPYVFVIFFFSILNFFSCSGLLIYELPNCFIMQSYWFVTMSAIKTDCVHDYLRLNIHLLCKLKLVSKQNTACFGFPCNLRKLSSLIKYSYTIASCADGDIIDIIA